MARKRVHAACTRHFQDVGNIREAGRVSSSSMVTIMLGPAIKGKL